MPDIKNRKFGLQGDYSKTGERCAVNRIQRFNGTKTINQKLIEWIAVKISEFRQPHGPLGKVKCPAQRGQLVMFRLVNGVGNLPDGIAAGTRHLVVLGG